jgi:hypothetical protein
MKEGTGIFCLDTWEKKNKIHIYKSYLQAFPNIGIVICNKNYKRNKTNKEPALSVSLNAHDALKLHKFLIRILRQWGPFNEDILKEKNHA